MTDLIGALLSFGGAVFIAYPAFDAIRQAK